MRTFTLLHDARPLLLDFGAGVDGAALAGQVRVIDARYDGPWELPVIGEVSAPTAVLVRPDGYVAWVGDGDVDGLTGAVSKWFGSVARGD